MIWSGPYRLPGETPTPIYANPMAFETFLHAARHYDGVRFLNSLTEVDLRGLRDAIPPLPTRLSLSPGPTRPDKKPDKPDRRPDPDTQT
jgi:hypothetical protein